MGGGNMSRFPRCSMPDRVQPGHSTVVGAQEYFLSE